MFCVRVCLQEWLPLHWAVALNDSTRVIQALLDAYPEGVTRQDNAWRTPKKVARFYWSLGDGDPDGKGAAVIALLERYECKVREDAREARARAARRRNTETIGRGVCRGVDFTGPLRCSGLRQHRA